MKKTLSILFLSILAVSSVFAEKPNYPDVTVDELQGLIDSGSVVLLDLNGTKHYNREHIPGAIDFMGNKSNMSELLAKATGGDKDVTIVSYCTNPYCKAYIRGAKFAEKEGYKDIRHLSVGISGWVRSGAKAATGS